MRNRMTEPDRTSKEIQKFFDCCADSWDCSARDRDKISVFVSLAGVRPGFRVADIACGTGILFPEILSKEPAFLLGVDISGRMIEKARSKFSDPRIHLIHADFFDVRETGFDVLFLYCAYPHFPDKMRLSGHMAQ